MDGMREAVVPSGGYRLCCRKPTLRRFAFTSTFLSTFLTLVTLPATALFRVRSAVLFPKHVFKGNP